MIPSMDSTRPSVRRSRWWLWVSLGVFVLLAIAAIPAWRYYWHTEYKRHLHTISRNPRDSYHEPPPWSVLASLPRSLQPIASRLRTVDLTSDESRPLTAADLRRLNQIIRYRQFGLGVERLCLTGMSEEAWGGLDAFQNLLYLQLRLSHLPADAGRRLSRLRTLNVLTVVGEPEHVPLESRRPQSRNGVPTRPPQSQLEMTHQIQASEKRQRAGIDGLWEVFQLEELSLRIPRPVTLAGHDWRRLRELHHLSLHAMVSREDILTLAELPALRMLDLRGVRVDWRDLTVETLADWRARIAEFRELRPEIDLVPPGLPTEAALVRWQQQLGRTRRLKSSRQMLWPVVPAENLPPTFIPDAE